MIWLYTFSSSIAAPPTGNQIRFDAVDPPDVSVLWITSQTTDGIDVFRGLMALLPGTTIYVQDKNDHTKFVKFRTTEAPIDLTSYVEVPVVFVDQADVLNNSQAILLIVEAPVTADDGDGTSGTDGPLTFSRVTLAGPLWTVAEVKAIQLRITDAAHDGDVEEKLATAQEAVLAFLGPAGDPSWTPATAPVAVKHAILLLTVHYYEHRGDDLGNTRPDEAVIWKELRNLLAMYRDPALA